MILSRSIHFMMLLSLCLWGYTANPSAAQDEGKPLTLNGVIADILAKRLIYFEVVIKGRDVYVDTPTCLHTRSRHWDNALQCNEMDPSDKTMRTYTSFGCITK